MTLTTVGPSTWPALADYDLAERTGQPNHPLLPTSRGKRLSRDGLERRLTKHLAAATTTCRSLSEKTVTPHTLRHTAAMQLLHAGVDTTVIALWLGHERVETTQIYFGGPPGSFGSQSNPYRCRGCAG